MDEGEYKMIEGMGSSVRRKEDARLVTGQGEFSGDLSRPDIVATNKDGSLVRESEQSPLPVTAHRAWRAIQEERHG